MNTLLTVFSTLCLLATVAVAADTEVSCEPGYFVTNSGGCKKCPKGSYQPLSDQNACKPCHDGEVAMEPGSTKCVPCTKPNTEANKSNDGCKCIEGAALQKGVCTMCEPGTFYVLKGKKGRCNICAPGTYQPEKGQTKCLPCPDGSLSNHGATECVNCAEGEFLTFNTNECKTCPKGQTWDKHSSFCDDCDPGTFKPEPGLGPCQLCPAGTTSDYGASSCTEGCPDGEALLKKGKCGKCPAGTYYDGHSKCRKCGVNTYMPYESIASSCFLCSGNTFAPKRGAKECVKCPFGTALFRNGECGICPPGFGYVEEKFKCTKCAANNFNTGKGDDFGFCRDCPAGSFAPAGAAECTGCSTSEVLIAKRTKCGNCKPGFFYHADDFNCLECPDGQYQPDEGAPEFCLFCPDGTVSNKKRTACVPE